MDREQLPPPTFLHGITCVFAGLSLPPSARETFDKSIVFQGDGIKDEAETPRSLLANYRNSPGELAYFTFDAPRTKRIGGRLNSLLNARWEDGIKEEARRVEEEIVSSKMSSWSFASERRGGGLFGDTKVTNPLNRFTTVALSRAYAQRGEGWII